MPDLRIPAALLILAAALAVSGCGSTVGGTLPEWAGGEPTAITPVRPAVLPAYPAVGDMPPPRDTKLITPAEQTKLEADLTAARDAQNAQAQAVQKDHDAEMAQQKELEAHSSAAQGRPSGSN